MFLTVPTIPTVFTDSTDPTESHVTAQALWWRGCAHRVTAVPIMAPAIRATATIRNIAFLLSYA